MKTRRIAAAILVAALAAAAAFDLAKLGRAPWDHMVDLSAFYCAGTLVRDRQNPYALPALQACERRLDPGVGLTYAIPAPLPAYDFAPFAALSRVEYGAAQILMRFLVIVAGVVAALALSDIGVPLLAAFAALALSCIFVGLTLGQIYPFTVALIALCAAMLARRRETVAGILGGLTMIQPQLGVPVCLSLLLWIPRSRAAIVATASAMALLGAWIVGPRTLLQWAVDVVPAQARFEAGFYGQYSLTSVLTAARLPPNLAITLGTLSFLLMVGISTVIARHVAQRRNDPVLVVAIPPALCLLGGSYVHLAAMAAAIPLALLVVCRGYYGERRAAIVPLLLLSIPWPLAQATKALFFLSVLVVVVQLVSLRIELRRSILLTCGAAALLYLIALYTPPPLPPSTMVPAGPDLLREVAKIPTWAALIWLFALSLDARAEHERKPA